MSKRSIARKKRFAEKLNLNPAQSERWFFCEWVRVGMALDGDLANSVFCGYIPDVVNHDFKYIIEVDGSIHRLPHVKQKDAWKDKVFGNAGYEVFRLKAFNEQQFEILCDEVSKLRDRVMKKKLPKTILRRAVEVSNGRKLGAEIRK